jgi:hypothetical protein
MYNFAPLPPAPPIIDDSESDTEPAAYQYEGGVIMGARRMKKELFSAPPPRIQYGRVVSEPRKPIPGWTDGSNAWREQAYNISSKNPATSFTARSSNGIPCTLSRSWARPTLTRPTTAAPVVGTSASDAEMLDRFSASFTRSTSSSSLPSSPLPRSSRASSSSLSSLMSCTKKERPLVAKGAEGKLLVPNVKMRVPRSGSSSSLASQMSSPSRKTVRSPLSQCSSSEEEEREGFYLSTRPRIESKSLQHFLLLSLAYLVPLSSLLVL